MFSLLDSKAVWHRSALAIHSEWIIGRPYAPFRSSRKAIGAGFVLFTKSCGKLFQLWREMGMVEKVTVSSFYGDLSNNIKPLSLIVVEKPSTFVWPLDF